MGVTLEGKLVVAISSRALFDFEEENRVFETGDDRAYMKLQLDRLDQPAQPGVAWSKSGTWSAVRPSGPWRTMVARGNWVMRRSSSAGRSS